MNNKRKSIDLIETSTKKSKSEETISSKLENDYKYLINLLTKNASILISQNESKSEVLSGLNYFKSIFPSQLFENLPEIIHLHQLYSLISNKTQVDREIDSLRHENQIVAFKFVSNLENETLLCFTDDFKNYVRNHIQLNPNHKLIVDKFLDKVLANETSQLSISKLDLLSEYKVSDSDITILIQLGLLAIKDPSNFWFSIPNMGKFRRILLETRKSLIDLLRRQKYKEINLRSFFNNLLIEKNKSFKNINKIGAIYVICDLIGNDVIRKIDSPMGMVVKIN